MNAKQIAERLRTISRKAMDDFDDQQDSDEPDAEEMYALERDWRVLKEAADLLERMAWQPIETAPTDGRMAWVFRPLARMAHDEPMAVKQLIGGNNHCWPSTVPDGATACNPTDGCCHVTHWMPLPDPPGE